MGRGTDSSSPGSYWTARGWPHGRMRDNGHQLLREHVERIAREAGGLDVALVHGAGDGGAGHQVGAVFGKEECPSLTAST